MKLIQLIHNPHAGDGTVHKGEVLELLKKQGYECRYFSTKKKGWNNLDPDADILLIAGGDGTIRKVTREILELKILNRPDQLAVLPLGTANNISKALKIKGTLKNIISSWDEDNSRGFDVGRVLGIKSHHFFLESFGYGAFPYFMQRMDKHEPKLPLSRGESINIALEAFHHIILSFKPTFCKLQIDGTDHSGSFLMVEIMNTSSIGPGLNISPKSDPGDGEFEVVMVTEKDREKLAASLEAARKGQKPNYHFNVLKGKNIKISCESPHVHLDDQYIKLNKGAKVSVYVKKKLLNFLVT